MANNQKGVFDDLYVQTPEDAHASKKDLARAYIERKISAYIDYCKEEIDNAKAELSET
jgi:predicted nucleotide-binding protein